MKNKLLAILLLIFFSHSAKGDTPVNDNSFLCEMFAPAKQQLDHGVYILFTVTNLTDHKLQLLTWYTPFEGFLSDLFIIKSDVGDQLKYNGMMVKRVKPSFEDYLILPAKEKVEITLDLTQVYSLTQGEYTVHLASKNWHYISNQTSFISRCLANKLSIKVE